MTKKKIAIVAGTRPEVIKMAQVYHVLKTSDILEPVFISTAQHRQMLDQALQIFSITPDFDMNIMQAGQTLTDLTARLLSAWKDYFSKSRPDAVLVQGDTTTVLATSIAAFYERIPIGHIEAGLRTYNFDAPFPEEMNRRLTDPISKWCFAPTKYSYDNLIREGVAPDACFITGNTVIDSLLWMREKLAKDNISEFEMAKKCGISEEFAREFLSGKKRWILVTGHRRENFGGGFENICAAIKGIADKYEDVGIVYPVHLNPNVQEPVNRLLAGHGRIALIKPLSYEDFIWFMDKAYFVLSDSGGVQEEAPSLSKPVLVMRETTERPEGVEAGTCELVGTDVAKIMYSASKLLDDGAEYRRRAMLKNPYGDGTACLKIKEILEKAFVC
ncbi:MAG: UDP-N-acetylglucosamine 2-epimerase (non-hydrolyzing) [Opitutales bacterium]|nr:UDP-N-acetylglucosamine 2-epimerase (non-hydrolyzing) [Opitutales bacterium]